eukprot:jgi/Chrzof1/3883/Cz13g12020.t1
MINTACNDLATLLQAPKKTHAKATAGDTSTAAGVTIKPEPGTPEEQDNMERLGRLYIKQEPATAAAAGAVKQEPGVGAGGVPSGPVLEQGKVYFFYRPRVEVTRVRSAADVARFEFILEPTSRPDGKCRLIIIPKKRLPDVHRHERFFGFVDAVADDVKELTAWLGHKQYDTQTRGHRLQDPARLVGAGSYALAIGGTHHAPHWSYALEIPDEPEEAQKVFNINKSGSYVVSVRNPHYNPPGVPKIQLAREVPEDFLEHFRGKRKEERSWVHVDDPRLLEVEGAQLVFVGARDDRIGLEDYVGDIKEEYHDSDLSPAGEADEDDQVTEKHAKIGKRVAHTKEKAQKMESSIRTAAESHGGIDDKAKRQAVQDLIHHLEPDEDFLPVEPALTGQLV